MLAEARSGAPDPRVLLAETQLAGQGRRGRTWSAPARSSIMMSLLLRPRRPTEQWSMLSPLVAVALCDTLRSVAAVNATVKWPNDVLVDGAKIAGILAAVADGSVVVGMGVNVSHNQDDLPISSATSVALANGSQTDRETLIVDFLRRFEERYTEWEHSGASSIVAAWRERSATLGQTVRVELPGGEFLDGQATDINDLGGLLIKDGKGTVHTVTAAETVHLRPST